MFVVGFAIFSVASVGCALSNGFTMLVGFRVLQGMAAGVLHGLVNGRDLHTCGRFGGIAAAAMSLYAGAAVSAAMRSVRCNCTTTTTRGFRAGANPLTAHSR